MAVAPAPFIPRIQSAYTLSAMSGCKVLVYGRAGAGKTVLGATAPNVIFFSAEKGLLSLRKHIENVRVNTNNPRFDIPVVEINGLKQLKDVKSWAASSAEARQFETYSLDSVSEIAEQCVAEEKLNEKDPRKAYGTLFDEIMKQFREFRDIPGKNVYFIAKEEVMVLGTSKAVRYVPSFPGQALLPHSPYMFDETFNLAMFQNNEGGTFRALRTEPDFEYEAKDRSGRLAPLEYPDLTYIFKKMKGEPV